MPIQPIDIGTHLKAGFDPLAGTMTIAENILLDKSGIVRRRPVRSTNAIAPSSAIDAYGIDLLHVANNGHLYAVGGYDGSGRSLYEIADGAVVSRSATSGGRIEGPSRPVVAETQAMLVFTAGGTPHKYVFASCVSESLGGSPPTGSHVVANALRLLINDIVTDKTKINFSDIASGLTITGHETWGIIAGAYSGWFTAEARPDPVVALGELINTVFVWGTGSLQLYTPDVVTANGESFGTYSPVTTLENGCIAPYSIIRADDKYYWLDQYRRFVSSDGRSVSVVSDHIGAALIEIATATDCFGYRVKTRFLDCLVWTFPTDGRTFVLDADNGWSQWCEWNTTDKVNGPMKLTAAAYDTANGLTWVGTSDGYVRTLGHEESSEDPLVARVRTGYEDHGTGLRKQCEALFINLRRGETSDSSTTSISVSWSDVPGQWSTPIVRSLGTTAERETSVVLRSLGVYRTRAWQFVISGQENVAIASILEQYEVMEI